MLIAELMALLESANVPSVSRNECLQTIFRSLLGIRTYAKQRQTLRKLIGDQPESSIWCYMRDTANRGTHTSIYWRAFGRFLNNRDAHTNEYLGVPVEDLWYMLDILDRVDIETFINIAEERGYNKPPAAAQTVTLIMNTIKAQIRTCSRCLSYVVSADPGFSIEDWAAHFRTVAVRTIYQYDYRSIEHLIATVRSAVWKELSNTQKRYGFEKYSTITRNDDGTFTQNRMSLEVKTDDGGFIDVPGLHGKFSTQTVESDMDVTKFLAEVERQSTRIAAYLRDVTFPAQCSNEFGTWLDRKYPGKHLDDNELRAAACKFYKITSQDLDCACRTLSTMQHA